MGVFDYRRGFSIIIRLSAFSKIMHFIAFFWFFLSYIQTYLTALVHTFDMFSIYSPFYPTAWLLSTFDNVHVVSPSLGASCMTDGTHLKNPRPGFWISHKVYLFEDRITTYCHCCDYVRASVFTIILLHDRTEDGRFKSVIFPLGKRRMNQYND